MKNGYEGELLSASVEDNNWFVSNVIQHDTVCVHRAYILYVFTHLHI